MKRILIIIFAILTHWSYPQETKLINTPPENILDYYYLLPKQVFEFYEDGDVIENRINYLNTLKTTIDKKNAYLNIEDTISELQRNLTLTYFNKADGNKIITASNFLEGGDCDIYETIFYAYIDRKWIVVSKKVLPTFSLQDFGLGTLQQQIPEYLNLDSNIHWKFTLPQFGTTIKLEPVGLGEAICFEPNIPTFKHFKTHEEMDEILFGLYPKVIASRKHKYLELIWERNNGVFLLKK